MKMVKFEDSFAWQKARHLNKEIYSIFKNHKDFGFRDQICRASVSVMNNIAEGFERSSKKELQYFLYISRGSCGEVRSMLYVARDLNYITDEQFLFLSNLSSETSRLIFGFIRSVSV